VADVRVHPEVEAALDANRAVVALESAVITAGLPRTPVQEAATLRISGWREDQPCNLELARAMQRAVREHGAVPATIAVMDGSLRIGLDEADLVRLAADPQAKKASITNLASCITSGTNAGTTVSATLAGCKLSATSLRVFATGGIGGVHRGWATHLDLSADLHALANSPVAVVCSGAKSILDLPATLEYLEALGIPIVGYRTTAFPQFQCLGDNTLKLSQCVDDVAALATVCRTHWNTLRQTSSVIAANPVPQQHAMNLIELDRAVQSAEDLAQQRGISGAARTPFLLQHIAEATAFRSLIANVALLLNNAALAGSLAVELSRTAQPHG